MIGLLSNAADTLDGLTPRKHPHAASDAFALREAAGNIEILFADRERFDEFAEIYCLKPEDIERRANQSADA
ncbi:MAG: hypothetical protein J0H88_16360 [Sphingomonadales bacterium]|nr:hypothetical protein [Sphingomonadales bacterium]